MQGAAEKAYDFAMAIASAHRLKRAIVVAGLLHACAEDNRCPDAWGDRPLAPRTGERCDPSAFEACSDDPQSDPWFYECVSGRLEALRNGLDQTLRCVIDETGAVGTFSFFRDLKAGECYTPEGSVVGPSTGAGCDREGSTHCAADPASDPWFYVCRDGALQVFDHASFRGAARCVFGPEGAPFVRYGG